MKKLTVLLLGLVALSVLGAQEQAEAEGAEKSALGLSAGLEFGFGDIADEAVFSLTPNVIYENSFGASDVFAELDYTHSFSDPQEGSLYLEEELGYNIKFGARTVFSVIANNNNTFFLYPELEEGLTHLGTFEPRVKITQTFGFGDLYLTNGLPYYYLTGFKDETATGYYLRLGLDSAFALNLWAELDFTLDPESGFAGYGFFASYDAGIVYVETEFGVDTEWETLLIKPEVDVILGALTFYARAEFYKFAEIDEWQVFPFVGAKCSF